MTDTGANRSAAAATSGVATRRRLPRTPCPDYERATALRAVVERSLITDTRVTLATILSVILRGLVGLRVMVGQHQPPERENDEQ